MGTQERLNQKKSILLGDEGNSLVMLLAINAIVFGVFNFIKAAYFLGNFNIDDYYKNILAWMLLHADMGSLAAKPWALLTHMFTQDGPGLEGIAMLFGNMIWLWFFGFILQTNSSDRHLVPLYLYGGIAGAFSFLLVINLFPALHTGSVVIPPLQGAGASVMAIALATTTQQPRCKLLLNISGGIPLWIITVVFAGVSLAMVAGKGIGFGVAQLTGGFMGYLYMVGLKRGLDTGAWMHSLYSWFLNLFNPMPEKAMQQMVRDELFYKQSNQPAYTKKTVVTQQKIDDILDKISQQGYHLLTEDEKKYLHKASKEV